MARSGDAEREMFVDIVDTDVEEYDEIDRERFREPFKGLTSSDFRLWLRSASFFASVSSAMPFLLSVRSCSHSWRLCILAKQIIRDVACKFWDELWVR